MGWLQSPRGALPGLQLLLQKGTALLEVLSRIPQLWLDVSGTEMSLESALSSGCLLVMVC